MLDPAWAATRPVLWVALAVMLALLVVRAIRADRTGYQKFKRFRTTAKRQTFYRAMLRGAALQFGAGALIVLLFAGQFVAPLLGELAGWPVVADLRRWIATDTLAFVGILLGLLAAFGALTWVGVRAARQEGVATIGDVAALLPRNRQELRLGWILSINAGVSEELMMRLALPALIYGATGSAVVAVFGSILLFGALHLYQGWTGLVATTLVGATMMLLYAVSGTILVPIVVHALIDLRSLVFIPWAVYAVHRIDGVANPIARVPVPAGEALDDATAPVTPAATPES